MVVLRCHRKLCILSDYFRRMVQWSDSNANSDISSGIDCTSPWLLSSHHDCHRLITSKESCQRRKSQLCCPAGHYIWPSIFAITNNGAHRNNCFFAYWAGCAWQRLWQSQKSSHQALQGHQYLALQVISKPNWDNFPWYFLIFDTFTLIIRLSDNRM